MSSRTTANVCLTLRPSTVQVLDTVAALRGWSRSQLVDLALSGADRLGELQAIADAGLEANAAANAKRPRAPNATQVVAENSTSGHAALRALNKIAQGTRK
jgi:hypothetical protein